MILREKCGQRRTPSSNPSFTALGSGSTSLSLSFLACQTGMMIITGAAFCVVGRVQQGNEHMIGTEQCSLSLSPPTSRPPSLPECRSPRPLSACPSSPRAASSRANDFQICEGEPIMHTLGWVIYESNCAPSGLHSPEIDVVGRGSGSQPQTQLSS